MKFPIFVISLPRSLERRKTIELNLRNLGLPFEFVDGVDATNPSVLRHAPYNSRLTQATISRQLSPGEIGCAMAHISLWKKIVREEIEQCLILEDDALLSREAVVQIENAFDSRLSFDALNLISDVDEEILDKEFLSDTHFFTRFKGLANRLSAYVLTLAGATKLMSVALPIRMELDRFTGQEDIAGLAMRGIFPSVATLQATTSEIWGNANNPPTVVVWDRKLLSPEDTSVAVLNPKLRRPSKKKLGSRVRKVVRRCGELLARGRRV